MDSYSVTGVQHYTAGIGQPKFSTVAQSPVLNKQTGIAKTRAQRIDAFGSGPIAIAPARVNSTAYALNDVFTRANGAQFIVTVAGTTAASEPTGLIDGRPLTDGTVVGYFAGFSKTASDAEAPTVSQVAAAGFGAAGISETRFVTGTAAAIIASSADGLMYNNNQAYLGVTQGASGTLAGGAGNSPVTNAFGLPVAIGGESLGNSMSCVEFIVEDTKFGLTTHNFGFTAIVLIDGRPVIGNGAISVNSGGGNAIVFDFNGLSKPRRVSVYTNNGASANIRGVALTPQGKVYAVPRNGDVMLAFGDSYNTTVVPGSSGNPNSSFWLKNYLGLDGLVVMAVGGSGYVTASANTYNLPAVLASPSNRLLFPYYNPQHILVNTGGNDGNQPIEIIKAAALDTWQQIRANFPFAKITITDGNSGSAGPSAAGIAISAALQAQFAVWADGNSRFIPVVSSAASTAWVTGTGNVGAALTTGNSSLWTSTDGVHPSPGGSQFLGLRLAQAIAVAWDGAY